MENNRPSNRWVRYRACAYMRGRGFSYGVNGIFPRKAVATGKYLINCDDLIDANVAVCDGDFRVFAPNAFDYVFIGPKIVANAKPTELVEEAAKKLKDHGHLIIHCDRASLQWVQWGKWRIKEEMWRDGQCLTILKKLGPGKRAIEPQRSRPKAKRVCVVRYGALGDAVMITPLLAALKADGYHVTLNVTPYAAVVFENNPHVDNFIYQEREVIPNPELGEYWKEWEGEYDRYINLSESVEGSMLRVEGRRDFYTSQKWRGEGATDNYTDRTLALGGYSTLTGQLGHIYLNSRERSDAERFRKDHADRFIVLWALNGSSAHKFYALTEAVVDEWCKLHPETLFVTVGDQRARAMEFDHPNVVRAAGVFGLRQIMALTSVVDLVIGPESAIVNFASCFPTPKITLLSHSTHDNLCKHWENDYCLTPDRTMAPCYPCHQLHYTAESCPQAELLGEGDEVLMRGPACAMGAISIERMLARMEEVYESRSAATGRRDAGVRCDLVVA